MLIIGLQPQKSLLQKAFKQRRTSFFGIHLNVLVVCKVYVCNAQAFFLEGSFNFKLLFSVKTMASMVQPSQGLSRVDLPYTS